VALEGKNTAEEMRKMRKLADVFTAVMERYLPDAYLFAIILTLLAAVLAFIFATQDVVKIFTSWGDGISGIFTFTTQMILILITGHALALTRPVKAILEWVAAQAKSPAAAVFITALVAGIASWIQWGFGLIVGGLLALEMARRIRGTDFPLLVAAAYGGFLIWHQGLSGSVPLTLATKDLPQNFVQKTFGLVLGINQTIFTWWNLVPAVALLITVPIILALVTPKPEKATTLDPSKLPAPEAVSVEKLPTVVAEAIEQSWVINVLFALLGVAYLVWHFSTKGFDLNLNVVILIFFVLGILLHWKPINYVNAINTAIRGAGGIALQFPLYGGIQGIMVNAGLGKVIAGWFVAISTPQTYYLLQFWAAGIINMFVPSGGGQWAVQGPITIEAAKTLGAVPAAAAMMVAWGDQWTNMIQPFWALPLLGLAGLKARNIMGYTTVVLLWGGIVLSIFAIIVGLTVR
jgi:short-chain fatty acids transporter